MKKWVIVDPLFPNCSLENYSVLQKPVRFFMFLEYLSDSKPWNLHCSPETCQNFEWFSKYLSNFECSRTAVLKITVFSRNLSDFLCSCNTCPIFNRRYIVFSKYLSYFESSRKAVLKITVFSRNLSDFLCPWNTCPISSLIRFYNFTHVDTPLCTCANL